MARLGTGGSPKVQRAQIEILLATYNGERFLEEQIDSLLAQTYKPISVLAHDDGSNDRTSAILAEYSARCGDRFRIISDGQHTGSAQNNFLLLMQHTQAQYVAFSDQDDVWLPSKLSAAMAELRELEQRHSAETPLLVFTDLAVVDSTLRVQAHSLWKQLGINPAAARRLERLLGQSIATGCTMLLNRSLLELAHRMPPEATMHDRWIALLACSLGETGFVAQPTMLYRQHEANVVGAVASDTSIRGLAQRAVHNSGRRAERLRSELQAEALLRVHATELRPREEAIIRAYLDSGRSANPLRRLNLTFKNGFFRSSFMGTAALLLDLARSRTR